MNKRPSEVDITLHNSLVKDKQVFSPLKEGHVSMYHCGPTVYNFIHVGNLRAFIIADLVRRVFEFNGYTTTQVMNITDIGHLQSDADDGEDKMTLALKREGLELNLDSMKLVALKYYDAFRIDLEKANVLPAHLYPFASDHIAEDITFVEKLLSQGNAYKTTDGIYFDTQSLERYGKLGGTGGTEDQSESRIGLEEESEKKSFRDFAVWKFNPELGYDAPFGKGFPGWHLECSVMSMKYLGDTFDIHTGGVDHISVHHNNEIAQSEAISHKLLANYWLHNEHVIVEGGNKMAKSGGNFITLEVLESKGISALGFRYWLLGASYRTKMEFSFEAAEQAEQGYKNLVLKVARIILNKDTNKSDEDVSFHINEFRKIINDDLNSARALAYLHEKVLGDKILSDESKFLIIKSTDEALGLNLIEEAENINDLLNNAEHIPEEIRLIAEKRQIARLEKNWKVADELRDEIFNKGYELKDTNSSYTLQKRLI